MQVDKKHITTSFEQTQKLGEKFAAEILAAPKISAARVLALQGNLGSGKTTFLQGFAKGLGVKEKILSPTFVILKRFALKNRFENFYHIDCYRLKDSREILELGFKKIISDPKNIVAIEWPEKIKKALSRLRSDRGSSTKSGPKNIITVKFKFIDKNKREISLNMV